MPPSWLTPESAASSFRACIRASATSSRRAWSSMRTGSAPPGCATAASAWRRSAPCSSFLHREGRPSTTRSPCVRGRARPIGRLPRSPRCGAGGFAACRPACAPARRWASPGALVRATIRQSKVKARMSGATRGGRNPLGRVRAAPGPGLDPDAGLLCGRRPAVAGPLRGGRGSGGGHRARDRLEPHRRPAQRAPGQPGRGGMRPIRQAAWGLRASHVDGADRRRAGARRDRRWS